MEHFIVSARKYRPATFASVVGQQHITSTLKNAIERGQLAHAYLFCGPRGVGKTTCARILAKAINCLHPVDSEACNTCESCRAFNEGRSLNIHELDAASNNSVDDIRSLIDQVRILPQGGRYSVFIIDEVHMLSAAAFNAFLKTLEEPPAHAVFILATTEKHKIIPTILSRCQIYDFNRIRVEDSVGYLRYIAGQEGVSFDEESLNLIAQKADGGMRDALSMFDKAVSFCGPSLNYKEVARTLNVLDYDTYFRVTETLLAGDYIAALELFDEVLSNGFSGQTFMAGLNRHMRDLLVAKNETALSLIELTGTLLERYRAQSGRCDTDFLFGAISLLTDADGRIRQSSNQRLLVELGLMKIAGLGQKKNNPISSDAYPLPELRTPRTNGPESAAAANPPVPPVPDASAARTAVQTPVRPLQAERPAEQSAPAVPTTSSATATRTVSPTESAAPNPESPAASRRTETPANQPSHRSAAVRIGGAPLSALLDRAKKGPEPEKAETPNAEPVETFDPQSGSKLSAARASIVDYIREQRPRFAGPFERMILDGHTIRISVPSQSLHDEMLRSKTEILTRIAELAGIGGSLRIEVSVDEAVQDVRPIKLEDRIRYLTEKNPMLSDLRKTLELEAE